MKIWKKIDENLKKNRLKFENFGKLKWNMKFFKSERFQK